MMEHSINAALQFVPLKGENRYGIIDKAIAIIESSGLKFRVCPFETVVEGKSSEVHVLIATLQNEMLKHCDEFLLNVKIHAANRDLAFEEKTAKFDS